MRCALLIPTLAHDGWDRWMPSNLEQTHQADEIIVVVDRATTESERKELATAWPTITFVFNVDNLGITRSLNVGLSATDADFIFRADDDDQSMPDRIERQLACFAETGADLVGGWAEGISRDGGTFFERCPTSHDEITRALLRRNVLIHPTLAFRREAVTRIGNYDPTFINAQDYDLYLRGLRHGLKFAAVPAPLIRRRYHDGNITVRRRMNQLMYSCAARCVHHAATADRKAFLRTLAQYALLAIIPAWARELRRNVRARLRSLRQRAGQTQ